MAILVGLKRVVGRVFSLLLVFGVLAAPSPGRAQQPDVQDYSRITQVPRAEIDAWLKQEVRQSGGDWSRNRYHLFVGFSTGHFGQDPVHAIAMRRVAFSIVNNSLAVGDRVTPIAWEMETWDTGSAVTLTEDPATRAEFANRVPYTPRSGSNGGHDIERALYETITKAVPAEEAGSAIVLLLTNSNASQAPTGEKARLFGANNPQLEEAIRKGKYRLPMVRKEFRLEAGSHAVTVAITALFPEILVPLPGSPDTLRYPTFTRDSWQPSADRPAFTERLPNETKVAVQVFSPLRSARASPAAPRPGVPSWVWAVVALAIIGILLLVRAQSAKGGAPSTDPAVAAKTPSAASGRPIPGSLTVTIGTKEQTLQPLTSESRWTLQRDDAGAVSLVSATPNSDAKEPAPAPGTPIAQLEFDNSRNLRVGADSGAQFVDLNGPDPAKLDSRSLTIAPGTKTFCRIVPVGSTTRTRFEVAYNTTQKGNRA